MFYIETLQATSKPICEDVESVQRIKTHLETRNILLTSTCSAKGDPYGEKVSEGNT